MNSIANPEKTAGSDPVAGLTSARWWVACGLVFAASFAASVPTAGDIGLTWDEPAYRYSQVLSAQWWERLAQARTRDDVAALLDADTLLYYWPYARHGINFHPPLAGQLNLAAHAMFGRWMKDIPSRRMASVLEFALTITIGFGFLARRYGPWVGGVMAGALLLMPRVYGEAHIAETDTPGLCLWAVTALAFWKGLHEPNAARWRVLVGILLGLAFLEKMAAVVILLPLVAWLLVGHLPRTLMRREGWADWVDGVVTSSALLLPLGIAFGEILRLSRQLPPPKETDLFVSRPQSFLPGVVLAIPLAVWVVRRILARVFRTNRVWGVERPALETWTAVLAFAPVVGWLGNPVWWRETLPRLAHYYLLNTDRKGALPDIQILYLGQTYVFSLPWHNAWVLIAITVPAGILFAALLGIVFALRNMRRDRLPLYFLLHLLTLPALRMLPTPAHDGVRLLLPSFFFLASFAGWGVVWVADGLTRLLRTPVVWPRGILAGLVLGTAGWQLVKTHPFELSYYNELIGGPRGAWMKGFELTYWYDAFNDRTLTDLNAKLPPHVAVDFYNKKSEPPTFGELQALGLLREDIVLGTPTVDRFAYAWLLTHDSKASAFTRLLFDMTPWYRREPPQLDGLRVATVADDVAVSRAWALWLLTDSSEIEPLARASAPAWVRRYAPWLRRFWGEGLTKVPGRRVNEAIFRWAHSDPQSLRAAAQALAARRSADDDPNVTRLMAILTRFDQPTKPGGRLAERVLRTRPQALVEATEILITRPDAVRTVLSRDPYTDPEVIGGYLDRGVAEERNHNKDTKNTK